MPYRLVVNFRPAFFSAATLTIIAQQEAPVRLTIAAMEGKWAYGGILDARSTRDLHAVSESRELFIVTRKDGKWIILTRGARISSAGWNRSSVSRVADSL